MNVIKVTPEMRTLALGRLGENEVTQFVFDVSDWLEEFPGATIGLANSLPHTNVSYPCALENEGVKVRATFTSLKKIKLSPSLISS